MNKKSFVILLIIFSNLVKGQDLKFFDCILLQKSVESEIFKEHFNICKYNNETLTIIDTNNYFKCSIFTECGRQVLLDTIYPSNIDVNKGSGIETKNIIVLFLKKEEGVTILSFWQPYTNGSLVLELRQKRNKVKVKTISYGVF